MSKVDEVVAWVLAKVTEILNQARIVIRKHDFMSIMAGLTVIVKVVEEAAGQFEGLDGEAKRKVAATVLNRLIDIPIVPESVEQWVFEAVINTVCDNLEFLGWDSVPGITPVEVESA